MSEKVENLAGEIWKKIQAANNILLHLHPGPDGDSVGGALAMSYVLESLGKKVTIISGDSPLPQKFKPLPGFEKIVEKNYNQIRPDTFDLFLIQDTSNTDMISKKTRIAFPPSLTIVVIDHHASNKNFGQINLVDDSYIANCQLLYDLFTKWGVEITHQIALCLIVGIYDDSGGFKFEKTNEATFLAAAKLSKIAPNFSQVIFKMENSKKPQALIFQGLALSSIKHYLRNQVAVVALSYQQLTQEKIVPSEVSGGEIVNQMISVIGWEIGVSIIEREKDICDISLRTRDSKRFDLTRLALNLGGGGHQAAAGATLKMPFGQAKETVLKSLEETYTEIV